MQHVGANAFASTVCNDPGGFPRDVLLQQIKP